MAGLKHSVTLFGFGYIRGEATFDEILKKVKSLGADGFEIVSPQMIDGHPNPSADWMARFQASCEEYEMTPVCYSIYMDNGKHKGRFLTEAERMSATINEMEYAKRMGFSIVRSQDALLPSTMKKLLPYAEELDLHLAVELHGPYSPSTPVFQEYAALFEETQSPHLGIVMDFSAFAAGAPATVLDAFPDDVCHKEVLKKIHHLFNTTEIPECDLVKMIYDEGGDEADELIAKNKIFTGLEPGGKMGTVHYRTKPDFDGFRKLLKYSKYMHGKYWHVDDRLHCEEIDYPAFLKIMKEENYQGFIASEYEGMRFSPQYDESDQIKRHIQMLDKMWEKEENK